MKRLLADSSRFRRAPIALAVAALLSITEADHGLNAAKPDQRSKTGSWSGVVSWPLEPIHAHVLPTGDVLVWQDGNDPTYYSTGSRGDNYTDAYVWEADVSSASNPIYMAMPNYSTDLFCSGSAFLANGDLLTSGGQMGPDGTGVVDANLFHPFSGSCGSWAKTSPMNYGRWYGTNTTLATGEVVAVSGSYDSNQDVSTIPEVYSAQSGGWRALSNASLSLSLYPRLFVAPNGLVFDAAPDQMTRYLNTSGLGSWTNVGNSLHGYRDYGSAVMYDTGKVMIVGGGDPPTNTAEVINLNNSSPTWQYTGSMKYARRQMNATLLPDGTVLATGGTSGGGFNNLSGAVYAAELWNPTTGSWTTLASEQVPRLYHSVAVLLPDATVMVAGGGRPAASGEPTTTEHRDMEIFSPPYLFKGTRPSIASAPASVTYGQIFSVATPDSAAISKVTWLRLSSTTHAFNMSQRINFLPFSVSGTSLNVTAPANANLCPPGYYLLFLVNSNGVPSVARFIEIQ